MRTMLALALIFVAGCKPHASVDAGSDAPASLVDANIFQSDTGTNHFDPCIDDSDCPGLDHCSVPPTQPPRADGTAPLQCRPLCAHDADCVVPLTGITYAVECADDGYCSGRCATTAGIVPCMLPSMCHVIAGGPDGYCFLPAR